MPSKSALKKRKDFLDRSNNLDEAVREPERLGLDKTGLGRRGRKKPGEPSFAEVARDKGVDESSLRKRLSVKGQRSARAYAQSQQLRRKLFVAECKWAYDTRYPIGQKRLLELANKLSRPGRGKKQPLGENWYRAFLKRHWEEIGPRTAGRLQKERAFCASYRQVQEQWDYVRFRRLFSVFSPDPIFPLAGRSAAQGVQYHFGDAGLQHGREGLHGRSPRKCSLRRAGRERNRTRSKVRFSLLPSPFSP
jgi:hypothetical protein